MAVCNMQGKINKTVTRMNGMKITPPSFKGNCLEHRNILHVPLFIDDAVGGCRQRRIGSVYKNFSEKCIIIVNNNKCIILVFVVYID